MMILANFLAQSADWFDQLILLPNQLILIWSADFLTRTADWFDRLIPWSDQLTFWIISYFLTIIILFLTIMLAFSYSGLSCFKIWLTANAFVAQLIETKIINSTGISVEINEIKTNYRLMLKKAWRRLMLKKAWRRPIFPCPYDLGKANCFNRNLIKKHSRYWNNLSFRPKVVHTYKETKHNTF